MPISDHFARLPTTSIIVQRDDRQRREVYNSAGKFINPDGLLESVQARGVLSPLIVTRENVLVAGERRLEASRTLGLPDVPVRFLDDLSPAELQEIELEENVKRRALTWQEEVKAVAELHKHYTQTAPEWSIKRTAQRLGLPYAAYHIRVARDLSDPIVQKCQTLTAAYRLLERRDERVLTSALDQLSLESKDFVETVMRKEGEKRDGNSDDRTNCSHDSECSNVDDLPELLCLEEKSTGEERRGTQTAGCVLPEARSREPKAEATVERRESKEPRSVACVELTPILCGDFLSFAPAYSGLPFNLIHCDFPYGLNHGKARQSAWNQEGLYRDSKETFFALLTCLFDNLDKLLAPSSHVLFWCPSDLNIQFDLIEMFRSRAPSLVLWPRPLQWIKSDCRGIVSDARRGPRHIYESALLFTREDRPIVKVVNDAYSAPKSSEHPSAKPEPMLREFLSMLVDSTSRVLDPTCGSGSALRVADSLGASSVFGLELDPEHAKNALTALLTARTLRNSK